MRKKLMEPVILKESSYLQDEYNYVKELLTKNNNADLRIKLKQLEYGIKGEESILYELKNAHMPMYILHDINLEYDNFKAQIDYLIITKNGVYVLEGKNLFGNIKVDYKGNFIRSYTINDKLIEEGIYSPITQNQKHLELLKLIGLNRRKQVFDRYLFEKNFVNYYKSLVVLANVKTILDDRDASSEIKDKIIKVDGLIDYLKRDNANQEKLTDKTMLDTANSLLEVHHEPSKYFDIMYKDYTKGEDNDLKLTKELKKIRYYFANKEGLPAYIIFTNKALDALVFNKPRNLEELNEIAGFSSRKSAKYGKRILEIIAKY